MLKIKNFEMKDCRRMINTLENKDDFYISQMRDGISIAYKPKYPESTNADFSLWIYDDGIKMYQQTPTLPIIKKYKSFNALMKDLQNMEE